MRHEADIKYEFEKVGAMSCSDEKAEIKYNTLKWVLQDNHCKLNANELYIHDLFELFKTQLDSPELTDWPIDENLLVKDARIDWPNYVSLCILHPDNDEDYLELVIDGENFDINLYKNVHDTCEHLRIYNQREMQNMLINMLII
mgnify:FL=1